MGCSYRVEESWSEGGKSFSRSGLIGCHGDYRVSFDSS